MRLLILGASGGVGRWVAKFASAAGHDVTAFVRPETHYDPPSGVRLERGSVLSAEDLAKVVGGHDAIISCIGAQRSNKWNLWSPLRPPPHVAERTARALVTALAGSRGRRVVAISAAGVGEGIKHTTIVMRWLIRKSTVGKMYRDLEAMERIFGESTLDWVSVRPVTLVDAKPSNRAKVLHRYRLVSMIGRADVAAWLLKVATDPAPVTDRTPMIGWW
jgi:putative NADH-flavin reductase